MRTLKLGAAVACSYFLLLGCSPKIASVPSNYEEDISGYRISVTPPPDTLTYAGNNTNPGQSDTEPSGPVVVENAVNPQVEELLDGIARHHLRQPIEGYSIQVYTGASRRQADTAHYVVRTMVPNQRAYLVYEQPNYKVKVGRYTSRLEAQKVYAALKPEFPSLIMIPEKIYPQ